MEVQLQELIEKIKTEGIGNANKERENIVNQAKAEAEDIIKKAKKEAGALVKEAEKEAARLEQSAISAVQQAARDLMIKVRKNVEEIFDSLIQRESKEALTSKAVEKAIVDLVKNWKASDVNELEILIADDSRSLEAGLKSALSVELKKGLEVKVSKDLSGGFRISFKDGSAFYDFSDEEIAASIAHFLNPRFAEWVKNA